MHKKLFLDIVNQMNTVVFWQTNNHFTQQIYLSKSFEHIWGRKCTWLYTNICNWYSSIYHSDIANVIAHTKQRLLKQSDFNLIMYRIVLPNKQINYIRDICYKANDNTFIGFSEQLPASTWEYLQQQPSLSINQATFHITVVTLLKLLFVNNNPVNNKLHQKSIIDFCSYKKLLPN